MARQQLTNGYTPATRNAPQWYVGYLVFQGGNPRLKRASLTGSGVIPVKAAPAGKFQPTIVGHVGPTVSRTGPGVLPSQMPFLTRLLANQSNPNSV